MGLWGGLLDKGIKFVTLAKLAGLSFPFSELVLSIDTLLDFKEAKLVLVEWVDVKFNRGGEEVICITFGEVGTVWYNLEDVFVVCGGLDPG